MIRVFCLIAALQMTLLRTCNNPPLPEGEPRAVEPAPKVLTCADTNCYNQNGVDFNFSLGGGLTYVVCNDNHSVSVYYNGVCKQTLLPGDLRRWYVYEKDDEVFFKDEPSEGNLGDGSMMFPVGEVCPLKLTGGNTPNTVCKYQLIGTDDIRNWGYGRARFNIYNTSEVPVNFVNVCIMKTGSQYNLWIKQSNFKSTKKPPAYDPTKCQEVTFDSFPNCP